MAEAKRITNFEGKRRQMQFIGKLMRRWTTNTLEACAPRSMSSTTARPAKRWRCTRPRHGATDLIADDDALGEWISEYPGTDTQQLRALIRQARKDAKPENVPGRRCATAAPTAIFSSWCANSSDAAGGPPSDDMSTTQTMNAEPPSTRCSIGIVSISDRASSGVYEDKGLPALQDWLTPRPEKPDHVRAAPDPRRAGRASAPR